MEKELRHFKWPVRVLKRGILQIQKKCRNPDDLRTLELLADLQNSISKNPKMASKVFLFFRAVAVRTSVREPSRQNGRRFSWPVRVLTSGILQIRKKIQTPGNLRILELFSDLQNSTCKYPYRPCEVLQFFSVWSCAELCERLGVKSVGPFNWL
jgi:hypothetical protein